MLHPRNLVLCAALLVPGLSACGGGGTGGDLAKESSEGLAVEALTTSKVADLEALATANGWTALVQDPSHRSARGRRLLRFARKAAGLPLQALVRLLEKSPGVASAETNAKHRLDTKVGGGQSQVAVFDDMLTFSSVMGQPALSRVDVRRLPGDPTGQGVVVAVLDGGFRLDHEALAGRLAGPAYDALDGDDDPQDAGNGQDDDGDGRADEGVGHGTAVAGVVLAVAPDAKVLPVRVLDDEGNGTALSLALGILHAVESGAHVINISACADVKSKLVEDVLREAAQADCLVVACAGNAARLGVTFPASNRYVLGVAGVDADGRVDPTTCFGDEVALAAPSVGVIAPHPAGLRSYGRWNGTSLAAPFVSGAAALLLDQDADLDPEDAGDRLLDDLAPHLSLPLLYAGLLGDGILDVDAALR